MGRSLKEKIYLSKDSDNELAAFFDDLVIRRRDDEDEWGLQASMVVSRDSFASKINENDGKEPHTINLINLYQLLKGIELSDMSQKDFNDKMLREIMTNCIACRILDCEDKLVIVCFGQINDMTDYQYNMLKLIAKNCKELKETNSYSVINLLINVNGIFYREFNDFSVEDYDYIESTLDGYITKKEVYY